VVSLINDKALAMSTTARSVLGAELLLIGDVTIEHLLAHRGTTQHRRTLSAQALAGLRQAMMRHPTSGVTLAAASALVPWTAGERPA
jgi:hypothetical protein